MGFHMKIVPDISYCTLKNGSNNQIWAATWQNQQNDCAPSEDSDQPGHPPSLIRVFAVHWMGSQRPKVSSCGQRRLWSDWADAQADESSLGAHSFCWFCHVTAHMVRPRSYSSRCSLIMPLGLHLLDVFALRFNFKCPNWSPLNVSILSAGKESEFTPLYLNRTAEENLRLSFTALQVFQSIPAKSIK